MDIPCIFEDFYFHNGRSYSCKISDEFIPKNAILKPKGRHVPDDLDYGSDIRRRDADVLAVIFKACRLSKIPQGLTKIYPNLKILSVWHSTLKNVHKNDLIKYRNLERIGLCDNHIEFVRGDLFEGFKDLTEVSIYGTKIKLIEPNLLDGLDKLDCVILGGDDYEIENFTANAGSLDDTKDDLILQYYKRHKDVKHFRKIDNECKQYKTEVQKLIEENKTLKSQISQKNLEISKLNSNQKCVEFCDIQLFLMNNESFKDLKITIDNHEFPVHKILLAARSPTLAELLENNPEVENLNLVDIPVDTFEVILKFCYTDEFPGDAGTNFLHLFAAAGKLKIKELKKYAATKLIDQIDENNPLDILKLSNKYEHEKIRLCAYNKIKEEYPKIAFEDEWAMDTEVVTQIIQGFKVKEEMIRKAEEEFENLMLTTTHLK